MEEERETTRYWCYACARVVNPVMEVESIKCSLCHGGFMEEMESVRTDERNLDDGSDSDRGVALWAPILLGMINTPLHHRRLRQLASDNESDQENDPRSESELDPELESLRQRRSSAAILHLLHGIRASMVSESEQNEGGRHNIHEGGRVIFVNPFSQTIVVQGGNHVNSINMSQNRAFGSFGDYFLGAGLEQLLQQLAENDPNRYGTPPAQKEAVEEMPTVTVKENSIQCSVCLDEFDVGSEARKMPCKHMFHGDCILPWLALHSSCPVCRYQLPADESKMNQEQEGSRGDLGNSNRVASGPGNGEERQTSVSISWPFSGLFSMNSTSGESGSAPREHEDGH
ncbi:hypothetical protein SSX86_002128 [Deinandra increscens subsp. villosa]|uniref:RING-type E3 ubiquitin transferase n=1 Tax=Deinandra increscens subsp. villosa TaxID=3103831 RepID=A0AAP0DN04_9ASTR